MMRRKFSQLFRRPESSGPRGFTLIELLIVVAIISILAAIALPNFMEAQMRAKVAKSKSNQRTAGMVLEMYRIDDGDYPTWFMSWPDYNMHWGGLPLFLMTTPIPYVKDGLVFHDELSGFEVYSWERVKSPGSMCLIPWAGCGDDAGEFDRKWRDDWQSDPHKAPPASAYYVIIGAGPGGRVLPPRAIYDTSNGTMSEGSIYRYGP